MTHHPTLAVLGGGQLGRMLGLAAIPLGIRCRFLDPSATAGASAVGELIVGALDDLDAVARLIEGADALTYEWEGVPCDSLLPALRAHINVNPGSSALASSQDRGVEKAMFARLGIPIAPFCLVGSRSDLVDAVEQVGLPAILKTCQGGYDGKGQVRLHAASDIDAAWSSLGGVPLVLEAVVTFERELSVLGCRGRDGATVMWPISENEHRDGILRASRAPAPKLTDSVRDQAESIAARVMDELDYVGVICIELFQVGDELIANQFAPRVHNSGQWTKEGSTTSQFENHVRAVMGLPLGRTEARGQCVMFNAIGSLPSASRVLAIPGAHLHDYAKAPRGGRKVGHITLTDPSAEIVAHVAELTR